MSHKRRSLLAVLTAALLLALTAVPAAAANSQAAERSASGAFQPIVGELDGRTGADLFADSFLPDYLGPTTAPGECPRLGLHNRVVWLSTLHTCHLQLGDVAVALPGAGCSDVEAPPFYAVGEDAQRACARAYNASILSITVAVDGGAPVEIIRPAFAVSPPQRSIVIPADNPAGYPAGPATFTADGWAAVLDPVTAGAHTVRVVGTIAGLKNPVHESFKLVL
jgi:hypothetical protein